MIKLFFKGLLLHFTVLYNSAVMCGIDSIVEMDFLTMYLMITFGIFLILLCIKGITKKEFYKLSSFNKFNEKINKMV